MAVLDTSFIIQEFVPEHIYRTFKEKSIWFINPRMALFAQWLKDYTKSTVTINDWAFGGRFQNSGFRAPDCRTGAALSQHRFGNAMDVKVKGYSADKIRDIIRENFAHLHKVFGLTTIEKNTPTWVHVDFRYTGLDHLFEVNYN
jgi:hypothetical protein